MKLDDIYNKIEVEGCYRIHMPGRGTEVTEDYVVWVRELCVSKGYPDYVWIKGDGVMMRPNIGTDRVEFGDGEMYALDEKGTIRYSSWENDNKVGFYSCDLMDIKEVRVIPDETFERIAILDEVIRAKSEVLIAERDAINEKLALVRVDNRIDFEI